MSTSGGAREALGRWVRSWRRPTWVLVVWGLAVVGLTFVGTMCEVDPEQFCVDETTVFGLASLWVFALVGWVVYLLGWVIWVELRMGRHDDPEDAARARAQTDLEASPEPSLLRVPLGDDLAEPTGDGDSLDARLSAVARIVGSGSDRTFELTLTNTSPRRIVLWEWALWTTDTVSYVDLNMDMPMPPGFIYSWSRGIASMTAWPSTTEVLGVMVDAEPVEESSNYLYVPFRDGPIQLFAPEERPVDNRSSEPS